MIYLHIYDLQTKAKEESKKHSKLLLINNLSHYLEKKINKQELRYNENGKPEIEGCSFSISHSKNRLVQVFTKHGKIGIDVESINLKRNHLALAKRYFSPQEFNLLKLLKTEESKNTFYKLWTSKEAVCKAQGGRLWHYLKDNYLTKEDKIVESLKGLNIIHLEEVSGFSLSLASETPLENIKIIHE